MSERGAHELARSEARVATGAETFDGDVARLADQLGLRAILCEANLDGEMAGKLRAAETALLDLLDAIGGRRTRQGTGADETA